MNQRSDPRNPCRRPSNRGVSPGCSYPAQMPKAAITLETKNGNYLSRVAKSTPKTGTPQLHKISLISIEN
jgi:hypothetical protein